MRALFPPGIGGALYAAMIVIVILGEMAIVLINHIASRAP